EWHHWRMSSRVLAAACALSVALAALLGGCGASGNYRKDAAHEELLQALRECLVELPISGERGKDFVSPCAGRDVSSLSGISRGRLAAVLGPPRLCIMQSEISFPEKDDCRTSQDPLWSFYRHPGTIDMGGGPELVCVAENQTRCKTVEWRRTK
ncbi:MAG: hypothetical protein KGJ68_10945, partial [Gammaproteobacteria bacterium]|nr:hypothetical protein [Gammaproteobacteria bacterium]